MGSRDVVAGLAVTGVVVAGLTMSALPAAAENSWNPFADKDRAAARGPARAPQTRDPKPFLEPMTDADRRRAIDETAPSGYASQRPAPQPYPAVPQGYGNTGYQPPEYRPPGSGGQAMPLAPYGAPGTYIQDSQSPGGVFGGAAPAVERGELTPVVSAGGGLSSGAWQGLDANAAEQLLGPSVLPPASPALSELLNRLLAEPIADARLDAVRIAALWKAGRFDIAARGETGGLRVSAGAVGDPVTDVLNARVALAAGKTDAACQGVKQAVAAQDRLEKNLRGDAIIMAGYCAIIAGNPQAGGLAAELARDAGNSQPFTIAVLEAISRGDGVKTPLPRQVTVLDGLLVRELKHAGLNEAMLANATPGLLQLAVRDERLAAELRLQAAEKAAAANVVDGAQLAEVYRAVGAAGNAGDTGGSAGMERARQFVAAERNQAQFAKTRAIRTLLDAAQREGLFHPAAVAVAPIIAAMQPAQEISWFTETAVEVLAASGNYRAARQWLRGGPQPAQGGSLEHWLMLLDIADPEVAGDERGRSIRALENLALQGRFSPSALHRLATVLDALDYNVPIPLWNLASRTEQPPTGHLPETGFLSAMKQASQARQIAATVLYALRTIAPQGTTATHLLGLGDTIRALKRTGLEKDARRLGFEALFGDWPRTSS